MIHVNEKQQVCARCLSRIHGRITFQNNGTEICYPCKHELDIITRVTAAQSSVVKLKEFSQHGERKTLCPFCGRTATVYGIKYVHINCEYCGAIYQFNDGKFTGLVYDTHGKRYLPQELFRNNGINTDSQNQKTNNQILEDLGL